MRKIATPALLALPLLLGACTVPTVYMQTRTAERSGCPANTVAIAGENPQAGNGEFSWTARCEEREINCSHRIVDHEVELECRETAESFVRTARQTAVSKVAREHECDVASVSVARQLKAPTPDGAAYLLAACGAHFTCDVSPTSGATCRAIPADEVPPAAPEPAPPVPQPAPQPAAPPPPPPPTMPVDSPTPALPPAPPPEVSLSAAEINAVVRELAASILQDCPLATAPTFATLQILINSDGSAELVSAEPALSAETEGCVNRLVAGLQFRATTDEPRTVTTEQIRIVPEEYPQPE